MPNSFNLQSFLGEYKSYNKDYTLKEKATEAAELREIQQAEEAVMANDFLKLTLEGRLAQIGLGPRVREEIGKIAMDAVKSTVSPALKFLEDYEVVFDPQMFQDRINAEAKQTYFTKEALAKETMNTYGELGNKLYMDM